MLALIDADTIAFSCAATAENDELWVATSRADDMIQRLIRETNADDAELWLTGDGNFRYNIYPEYKANRIGAYRPRHEKDVKRHMREVWRANTSESCEADDMLGVRNGEICNQPPVYSSIMVHIDKDLDQLPGLHYNWELTRLGKTVREAKQYVVTPQEGLRSFYYQLIVGDSTDNIKGVPGCGPKAAERLLDSNPQTEWYQMVLDLYGIEEVMDMNAQCVYLWRKLNDNWRNLIGN